MTKRALRVFEVLLLAVAGCGSGNTNVGVTKVKQSGQVVSFGTTTGIAGVTVALGAATGLTDAGGLYEIQVAKNSPYEMVLTAPGYFKAITQEWQISADVDRGRTNFLTESQWAATIAAVAGFGGTRRDPTLGLVALLVADLPSCPTTGGATVSIAPSVSATRYVYVDDTGAASANTSTTAKPLSVHAIIYNVPVGPVAVSISSPSCAQSSWPVTSDAADFGGGSGPYTDLGMGRVEGGNAVSYLRVYLGQ